MTVVELLENAKNAIGKEELWAKQRYGQAPPHCAMGAIYVSARNANDIETSARWEAIRILNNLVIDKGFSHVEMFNDDPSTTYEDVINLFDEAILIAKENEKAI